MLEFAVRENMKSLYRILFYVMFLLPSVAGAAPVATTAGNNLTAYNPNSIGSVNNNQWNMLMNSRTGTENAPVADFGNCNALVLRCAQPKCATGGCTSMDITVPIVTGCVMDNATCKQHGDALIQTIAAQVVANSNAKAMQAAQQQQAAAAAQTSQQMVQMQQQMNMQMQQMQQQMQAQNDATVAQLQAALEEQKQLAAQQQQTVTVATATTTKDDTSANGLTAAQQEAAERGIDADLLVREQVSGEILSKLESAETALKALKASMKDTFDYAGCDSKGNNCAGPKRVKVFKQKAMNFFDPYNDVLDELYDALITAQAVGVDITDIYMMLNGSCNVWGEYLCSDTIRASYNNQNCPNGKSVPSPTTRGGASCSLRAIIGAEDSPACTLNRTLKDMEEVQRNWLDAEEGNRDSTVRIGCASSALESSALFRNRKKQADIDIEVLERIIEQDAPAVFGRVYGGDEITVADAWKYCAVDGDGMEELQKAVAMKKLPNKVCVGKLKGVQVYAPPVAESTTIKSDSVAIYRVDCTNSVWKNTAQCKCESSGGTWWGNASGCRCGMLFELKAGECVLKGATEYEKTSREFYSSMCSWRGGNPRLDGSCDCANAGDKFVECMKLSTNVVDVE